MQINLQALKQRLYEAPQEETVDTGDVNPYLLNEVLRPLLEGKLLCYGDVDYSRFEPDDLRALSYHCEQRWRVIDSLRSLAKGATVAEPCACTKRSFC